MNQRDTILVTGSNGFIGTWLVKKALEAGCRVRAVARNGKIEKPPGFDWDPDPFASPQLEIVRCDVTDRAAVDQVAEGCTHVFHMAGLAKNWCLIQTSSAASMSKARVTFWRLPAVQE